MSRQRRKPLSESDRALWEQVARSVRALPGRCPPEPEEKAARPGPRKQALMPAAPAAAAPDPTVSAQRPRPGIDRRQRRDLARGRMRIDSRIDLHGMAQAAAHERLIAHLAAASARGERCVLVITGKGGRRYAQRGDVPPEFRRRSDFDLGAGVLRRMAPLWLDSPPLSALVQAFAHADPCHGGEGALYVLLRRRR